jgi:transposase InsO family protein
MEKKTSTIVQLNDTNYATWKFQIKMLLKQKEMYHTIEYASLLEYIREDEPDIAPEKLEAKDMEKRTRQWSKDNDKAISYIGGHIDTKFYKYVTSDKAHEVWNSLASHFASLDTANRMGVKIEFYKAQQKSNESLLSYLERVIDICDKLKDLGWITPDLEICIKILSSLSEEYRPIQLTCLMIPEEKLNTNMLRQHFAMDTTQAKNKPEGAAQANQTHTKFCTECGYDNHFAKNCRAPEARKLAYKAKLAERNKAKAHAQNAEAVTFITTSPDTATSNSVGTWYLDSAASHHMTNDPSMVTNTTESNIKVLGSLSSEQNISSVRGEAHVNELLPLNDVLLVPNLRKNLVSVAKITEDENMEIRFKGNGVQILLDNSIVGTGSKDQSGIYALDNAPLAEANTTEALWHMRMGHISHDKLMQLRDQHAEGVMFHDPTAKSSDTCDDCNLGKQIRSKISTSARTQAAEFGDVIYSDVCGPINPISLGGNAYFVSFIDDYTRASWIFLMQSKAETLAKFMEFRKMIKTQFQASIKRIHSDRGGEYTSKAFAEYCVKHGINHTMTPPNTPQLNGVAERYNRLIVEMARCMISAKNLDKSFWGEAVTCANFLRNRTPASKIGTTPYEKLFKKKPNLRFIKVFGSKVTYVPATYKSKLDKRVNYGILVGFSPELSSYKVWDTERLSMFYTKDLKVIDESSKLENTNPSTNLSKPQEVYVIADSSEETKPVVQANPRTPVIHVIPDDSGEEMIVPLIVDSRTNSEATESETRTSSETLTFESPANDAGEASAEAGIHNTHALDQSGVCPSNQLLMDLDESKLIVWDDPQSFEEALNSVDKAEWIQAMADEMKSFTSNEVFEKVNLTFTPRYIDAKWVFKRKLDGNGKIVRFKARLVAKGFKQKFGVDYFDVYAPVIRYETIRILISHAAFTGMRLRHFDVETAFLNGDLEEEIYLKFPLGCASYSHSVVKLRKSIYGLKQSGRNWNIKIATVLKALGFTRSLADQCLFIKGSAKEQVLIGLFVDDLIACGKTSDLDHLFEQITSHFRMKDLGELSHIVGMQVNRTSSEITICQSLFIKLMLEKFGMSECKSIATPSLENNIGSMEEFTDESRFRQAVGSLNYLAVGTRPDISQATHHVATKMTNPSVGNWNEVLRIMRYLKGTSELKLTYKCNLKSEGLTGYSDASYATPPSRKSTSGFVFLLNEGAITWRSRRQHVIALSTTEAEYVALCDAAREAIWIRQVMAEISNEMIVVNIFEDNTSSISAARGNSEHSKTKHIDTQYLWIKQAVEMKKISITYKETEEMTADMLTKPLGKNKFEKHRRAMNLI